MNEKILTIVCEHFGIARMEIDNKSRRRDTVQIVSARQTATFLLWRYTELTGQQIADILGYKNKQNVYDARKKIEEISNGDHAFATVIKSLEDKILRK